MNQLSAGVNKKVDNLFNQDSQDFGRGATSGVFGVQGGSAPGTLQTSPKLGHRRTDTFGSVGGNQHSFMNQDG